MNTRKTILVAFSLLIITAFVLSACQPVVQTVEVPVEVIKTEVVEVVTTQEVTVVETQVVEVEREAFTTPHPILGDLRVRQALAYCTNKLELVQSVYQNISPEAQEALVMNSWIPNDHWAYAGDENITIYPFDPEKGMALLEEAGWTLPEGAEEGTFRANAEGEELAIQFATTTATFRQTWAAVLEQQYANCGIRMVRLHVPASWWFGDTTGLARRDFTLGGYAWVGEADPGGLTLYSCDQVPSPSNGWEGQNYSGWCNEAATAALKNANNTLIKDERIEFYKQQQAEFTKDIPVLPLFNRSEAYVTRPDLEGFLPVPGEEYYTYNAGTWSVPGEDTIVFGFTQEPASLFGLVEDAYVTHAVLNLLGADDKHYTSLNYDFQPFIYEQLSTIENGLTQNNDVEVNEGDKVIDANGEIVELAAGMTIRNAAGEEVEYTGGPVTMKQLVVTYDYRDDLKWPDGTAVTAEDLMLGYTLDCDKESGSTSFITCDKTVSYEAMDEGLKAVQTMLPGDQYPLYFADRDFRIYPANRVLADGRLLKDVPAKEWATLPEIAESPWGFGPYMITDWVKGEKMVLEAHPYWYGGTPATPNVVISMVTAENAEAQLLGGQIDLLDNTTFAGALPETMTTAEAEGRVKTYVEPSATWEHIDIALFVK